MRIILEAIAGPHIKKRVLLAGYQKATFGRTEWADYPFPDDAQMSGTHFSVEGNGKSCLVRDLGSTNGTYVDEERVVERVVVTGSVIRAGQTKVLVTLEGVPAGASAPARPAGAPVRSTVAEMADTPTARAPRSASAAGASATFRKAIADDDPLVRRNALLAAAWTRQAWVLEYCRSISSPAIVENSAALLLLAILGQGVDLPRIMAIVRTAELGPSRFRILGAFGHPHSINDAIVGMGDQDPATSLAAAAAFAKITGIEVVAQDLSPNCEIAMREWAKRKSRFEQGQRWCRGFEVSRGLVGEAVGKVDLESRFEACLRGRFDGTWKASRRDVEQLADMLWS